MDKKGTNAPVIIAGELVFIGIVIVIFASISANATNPLFSEQLVTAEDVARSLSVAQGIAYDFHYEYPESLAGHVVILKDNSIRLQEKGSESPQHAFGTRTFSQSKEMSFLEQQEVDVSYFYIDKKDDNIKLGDGYIDTSQDLTTTTKEKPEINIYFENPNNLGNKNILEKITSSMKTDLTGDFKFNESGPLFIKISIHDHNSVKTNAIYYSSTKQQETKELANNIQKIFVDSLNLQATPLAKSYDNKMVVEISISDEQENLNNFRDSSFQRRASLMLSDAIKAYYGGAK